LLSRKTTISFDKDEYIRGETTQDKLGGLRAAFQKDGAVTAGNSSGINDGSAMLILASEQMVEQHGLKPLAKIVSYGFGGVPPRIMGMGPVPATRMALEKSDLKSVTLMWWKATKPLPPKPAPYPRNLVWRLILLTRMVALLR
jgi:acetyl-CoA C-acetyltransferase